MLALVYFAYYRLPYSSIVAAQHLSQFVWLYNSIWCMHIIHSSIMLNIESHCCNNYKLLCNYINFELDCYLHRFTVYFILMVCSLNHLHWFLITPYQSFITIPNDATFFVEQFPNAISAHLKTKLCKFQCSLEIFVPVLLVRCSLSTNDFITLD